MKGRANPLPHVRISGITSSRRIHEEFGDDTRMSVSDRLYRGDYPMSIPEPSVPLALLRTWSLHIFRNLNTSTRSAFKRSSASNWVSSSGPRAVRDPTHPENSWIAGSGVDGGDGLVALRAIFKALGGTRSGNFEQDMTQDPQNDASHCRDRSNTTLGKLWLDLTNPNLPHTVIRHPPKGSVYSW